jgi:ABC-type amino acid transport substrate-binding protein
MALELEGPILLCVDPDWEPYERVTADGEYVGIAPDLLRLIFDRAGLEFDVVRTANWDESLSVAREGECHAIGFLNQTAERSEWLLFTDP